MKVKIKEKFEVAFFNPATRQFEGGSWHARVTVDGKMKIADIKKIQNVIDRFDHSTVVEKTFITEDEVSKISKRYTVLEGCTNLADMLCGLAKVVVEEIKKIDETIAMRIEKIEFWRDNNDIEFEFDRVDLDECEVKIIAHEVDNA